MTRYTVQCSFASYDIKTVVVDADTLNDALEKAISEADDGYDWESTDRVGDTFVDAVAQGDVELWSGDAPLMTIPARFNETGEGPRIIVIVSGGVVQGVSIDGGCARVEVRDYDNGKDHPDVHTDAEGRRYALADGSNVISADKAG